MGGGGGGGGGGEDTERERVFERVLTVGNSLTVMCIGAGDGSLICAVYVCFLCGCGCGCIYMYKQSLFAM